MRVWYGGAFAMCGEDDPGMDPGMPTLCYAQVGMCPLYAMLKRGCGREMRWG
jgi:hypothetical protein